MAIRIRSRAQAARFPHARGLALLVAVIGIGGAAPQAGAQDDGTERVRMTWDQSVDVDLHIYDAEGNEAYYGDPDAIPDGHLSTDDVTGFGPEVFTDNRSPSDRSFAFCAHYFGPGEVGEDTPTTAVSATIRDPDGTTRSVQRTLDVDESVLLGVSPPTTQTDCGPPVDPGCKGGISADDVQPDTPVEFDLASFNADGAEDAMCEAFWVPDREEGFIPQGLAISQANTAWLSGYINDDGEQSKSEEHCRVVHMSLDDGYEIGDYRFPGLSCDHGGGFALEGGRAYIADTDRLYALRDPTNLSNPRPVSAKIVDPPLRASFLVDGGPGYLWIGRFSEDSPAESKMWKFSTSYLRGRMSTSLPKKKRKISAAQAINPAGRAVPLSTQGADFDGSGQIWATQSASTWGELFRPITGGYDSHEFGPGAEEIDFDDDGCLWAVFEAGAEKYGEPYLPVVARFDPNLIGSVDEPNEACVA